MSEEIGKGEEKVSLLVFLEANHKILSVLGVFIALSVFTKNYLEGYFAIIASFNFLTIVILIWLEFLGRFPSKASSTTISLGLFEALFSYTVIIFFIVWFIDLNEFIPKAYKAITFILILVGLLSVSLVFFFSFTTTTVLSVWRPTIGIYMYSINLVILAYIIYNIYITTFSKAKKRMQLLSDILIPLGFITLTIGQILWVYWGFTDTNISLLLANLLFAIGLGFLSTSLLRIWRN